MSEARHAQFKLICPNCNEINNCDEEVLKGSLLCGKCEAPIDPRDYDVVQKYSVRIKEHARQQKQLAKEAKIREAEKAKAEQERLAHEPKPCPNCNAAISSTAVVCTHCGFDSRKKQVHVTQKTKLPIVKAGKDSLGRTSVSDIGVPRYGGILFISRFLIGCGIFEIAVGIVILAMSLFDPESESARLVSDSLDTAEMRNVRQAVKSGFMFSMWFWSLMIIVGGIIQIGIGQVFGAFRDMAINSYLVADA